MINNVREIRTRPVTRGKYLVFTGLAGLLLGAGVWGATQTTAPRSLADLALRDTRGNLHTGAEWRSGRALLLFFVTTDCPDGLKALYAWKGDLERDNDFNTKNLMMTGSIRFASGWTDPHGAYGSAGA